MVPQKQTMGDKESKMETCFCLSHHMPWESSVFLFYPRRWQSLPFSASPRSGKQACEQLQARLERAREQRAGVLTGLVVTEWMFSLSKYLTSQNLPISVRSLGTVHPDHFHWDQTLYVWCRELFLPHSCQPLPRGYVLHAILPTISGLQL